MNIRLVTYGNTLVSRSLAKEIFTKIDISNQDVILDFEGVNIVTPSFLHELLAMVLEKRSPSKKISFMHVDKSIETQLKKAISSLVEDNKNRLPNV